MEGDQGAEQDLSHQRWWEVGGKVNSAAFATVALTESRRSERWQATRLGEDP